MHYVQRHNGTDYTSLKAVWELFALKRRKHNSKTLLIYLTISSYFPMRAFEQEHVLDLTLALKQASEGEVRWNQAQRTSLISELYTF